MLYTGKLCFLVQPYIPITLILKVKKHYIAVARQLKLSNEEIAELDITKDVYRNRVIVRVESANRASVRALRYAQTISDNVIAFRGHDISFVTL